jgi:flagellar hook-basal body complex protein FliE
MKLREENNAKRQETVGKIGAILDEMGLTSLSDLDEDKKQALISKMFGNVSEDEAEDIEDEINKLGEPKKLEEGNAFIFAASKARQEGKEEFEFNGKTYKVTLKADTGLKEGNAFIFAASKARQEGKEEFEFNGKTYKVTLKADTGLKEGNAFVDAVRKAKEAGETEFEFEGETYKVEESLNEGKHGMAKKLLKGIVDGDSTEAEGIKMSKEMAEHFLYWINTSPYGKKNENLPLYMLVKASFNWGIERGLDSKLKNELEGLKNSIKESVEVESIDEATTDLVKYVNDTAQKTFKAGGNGQNLIDNATELASHIGDYILGRDTKGYEEDGFYGPVTVSLFKKLVDQMSSDDIRNNNVSKYESVESIDEARSINKIQKEWSDVTIKMAEKAKEWKAAEGDAKAVLLDELKEMTAKKKSLEAELNDAVTGKDKDLELVVTEAFFRLPKDVIGNELYMATQNLSNLYGHTLAGNDIDAGVIDTVIKALNTVKKSIKKFNNKEEVLGTIYEGKGFKNTKDFFAFLEEIDGMPESAIKKIMGKDYIDTPGNYSEEAEDYDNDIEEYMISNMGNKEYEKLAAWWENNVAESVVTEGATKQFDVDFNNMVRNIKAGYGWIDPEYVADTWENSSDSIDFELVKGEIYKRLIAAKLLAYADDEDEESAGQYIKSLKELGIKESVVNEAEIKSDDEFKEYAMNVLKKAFGADFDEAKAGEVVDGILKKCDGDYGACVGMLTSSLGESVTNESIDVDYWADYNDDTSGQGKKEFADKSKKFNKNFFNDAMNSWNSEADGDSTLRAFSEPYSRIYKMAEEFYKKAGWISVNVIHAMIMQEA